MKTEYSMTGTELMHERIRIAAVTEQRQLLSAINVNLRPGDGTPGATTASMILPHGLPRIGGSPAAPGNRADVCGAMRHANGGQSCHTWSMLLNPCE